MKTYKIVSVFCTMKVMGAKWHKTIVLALLSMMSLSGVRAQEFVADIVTNVADTSIVREIGSGKWLVYSSYFPQSEFNLYIAGSSTIYTAQLDDEMHISDFKKFGDQIYFCGYYYVNNVKTGMAGYFNISAFPSCQFYYFPFVYTTELKKMDIYTVYSSGYERHIVMTGQLQNGRGTVVDAAMSSATSWSYRSLDVYPEVFDEVATTNNYVVVSSRSTEDSVGNVNIRYFGRPTTIGGCIFTVSMMKNHITFPEATGPVALSYIAGDTVGVLYDKGGDAVLFRYSYTQAFPGISMFINNQRALQLKYLKEKRRLELLFAVKREDYRYGRLYTVPMTIFTTPAPLPSVTGHLFDYNPIWSIDKCDLSAVAVIASGSSEMINIPRLYRFYATVWKKCPEKISAITSPIALTGNHTEEYLPLVSFGSTTRLEMKTEKYETTKEFPCGTE